MSSSKVGEHDVTSQLALAGILICRFDFRILILALALFLMYWYDKESWNGVGARLVCGRYPSRLGIVFFVNK